jgi:hypothetical protein
MEKAPQFTRDFPGFRFIEPGEAVAGNFPNIPP